LRITALQIHDGEESNVSGDEALRQWTFLHLRLQDVFSIRRFRTYVSHVLWTFSSLAAFVHGHREENAMTSAVSAETDRWLIAARHALVSGTLASIFSTGVLAWLGHRHLGRPFAPTNATSHWLWGDRESFSSPHPSFRHTAIGYGTHHASALMWALFYERWLAEDRSQSASTIVTRAALMTAIAGFVDYRLIPKRLTPGFEAHLNRASIVGVFAAIAVGLATGAFLNRRQKRALDVPRAPMS
jgi:hypothetical protein